MCTRWARRSGNGEQIHLVVALCGHGRQGTEKSAVARFRAHTSMGERGHGRLRRGLVQLRLAALRATRPAALRATAIACFVVTALTLVAVAVLKSQPRPLPGGVVESAIFHHLARRGRENFLAYCPYGQFNNQRTQLANMAALAKELNRTLVIVDQIALYGTRWSDVVDLEPLRDFLERRVVLLQAAPHARGEETRRRLRAFISPGDHCMDPSFVCVTDRQGAACDDHCGGCLFAGGAARPALSLARLETRVDERQREWSQLMTALRSRTDPLLALAGHAAFLLRTPAVLTRGVDALPDLPYAAPLRGKAMRVLQDLLGPSVAVSVAASDAAPTPRAPPPPLWPPHLRGDALLCGYHLRVRDVFIDGFDLDAMLARVALHRHRRACTHVVVATDAFPPDKRRILAALAADARGPCTPCVTPACSLHCKGGPTLLIGCTPTVCRTEMEAVLVEQMLVAAAHFFVGLDASTFSNTVKGMRGRARLAGVHHLHVMQDLFQLPSV